METFSRQIKTVNISSPSGRKRQQQQKTLDAQAYDCHRYDDCLKHRHHEQWFFENISVEDDDPLNTQHL
jgi:hypothetical protein